WSTRFLARVLVTAPSALRVPRFSLTRAAALLTKRADRPALPGPLSPEGDAVAARWFALLVLLFAVAVLSADGPGDNLPDKVPPVPPPGIPLADAERAALQAATGELGKEIDGLKKALADKPALLALLPDVQVYHNAVRYALTYDEFYDKKEVAIAQAL